MMRRVEYVLRGSWIGLVFAAALFLGLAGCQQEPGSGGGESSRATSSGARQTRPRPTPRVFTTPLPTPPLPDFAEGSQIIHVIMKEYAYLPRPLTLRSGKKVTLLLSNRGVESHEFSIGRDVTPEKDGFKTDLFEGIEVRTQGGAEEEKAREEAAEETQPEGEEAAGARATPAPAAETTEAEAPTRKRHGTTVIVPAGKMVYMTFTLPPARKGAWTMACLEPGHYEAGMHETVKVE